MSEYIARWCLNTTASTQFTWPFKPSSPCTHRVSSQVSPSTIQCLCLFAFLFYPFYSVKQVEQLINRDVTYSTISRCCRRLRRWRHPHLPGLRGLRSAPSDQEARYCRWPACWWLWSWPCDDSDDSDDFDFEFDLLCDLIDNFDNSDDSLIWTRTRHHAVLDQVAAVAWLRLQSHSWLWNYQVIWRFLFICLLLLLPNNATVIILSSPSHC